MNAIRTAQPDILTKSSKCSKKEFFILFIYLLFKRQMGFLPGGSDTTTRYNTQNNTPHSNKTQHTNLHKQ
jgi:hypothetical protein